MTIANLKPAPYNARRIDAAAMAGLSQSIARFGNVQPVVWNRTSVVLTLLARSTLRRRKRPG
jgi:ParB-like chromosome segregation protein Spo0J